MSEITKLTKPEKILRTQLELIGKIGKGMSALNFQKTINSSREFQKMLDDIEESLEDEIDLYGDINIGIKNFGSILQENHKNLKITTKLLEGVKNLNFNISEQENSNKESKLSQLDIYRRLNKLNSEHFNNVEKILNGELKTKEVLNQQNKQSDLRKSIEQEILKNNIEIQNTESEVVNSWGEGRILLEQRLDYLNKINESLKEQHEESEKLEKVFEEQLKSTKALEKQMPLFSRILDGFKKIPILGDVLNLDEVTKSMNLVAGQGGSMFQTATAGAKSMGAAISSAMGPLLLITVVIKAFQEMKDLMFEADKQITGIAIGLNTSKDQAKEIRDRFAETAGAASELTTIEKGSVITRNDLIEAGNKYNEILGTSIDLTQTMGNKGEVLAAQFANILKYMNLSGESQKGLIGLSAISNKDLDKTTKQILGTTVLRKLESGILVNNKEILKDVLETNNSIKLSINGGVEALTKAAFQAKILGLNLNQIDKMADSFLDFESSISNELEAELLTGRDINLERERTLALANDIEGLTKEIGNNQELINTFSKSNRITQGAIAASLGLSREEMADMIVKEKELNAVKGKTSFINNELLDNLRKRNALNKDEFDRFKNGTATIVDYYKVAKDQNKNLVDLFGEQAASSLRSTDAQQKFNESLDAAKQVFTNFVDGGTLDKFAKFLTNLSNSSIFAGAKREFDIKQSKTKSEEYLSSNEFKNLPEEKRIKKQEELEDINKGINSDEAPLLWKVTIGKIFESLGVKSYREKSLERQKQFYKENNPSLETIDKNTAEDFIYRPGQPIQKFRKDDLIIGGTQLTKNFSTNNQNSISNKINELINNKKEVTNNNEKELINNKKTININNITSNSEPKGLTQPILEQPNYKSIEEIINNNSNQTNIENNKNNKFVSEISNTNNKITNSENNDELLKEFKEMKIILSKILSKEGKIYMDSQKVGTGINMNTYKIVS